MLSRSLVRSPSGFAVYPTAFPARRVLYFALIPSRPAHSPAARAGLTVYPKAPAHSCCRLPKCQSGSDLTGDPRRPLSCKTKQLPQPAKHRAARAGALPRISSQQPRRSAASPRFFFLNRLALNFSFPLSGFQLFPSASPRFLFLRRCRRFSAPLFPSLNLRKSGPPRASVD